MCNPTRRDWENLLDIETFIARWTAREGGAERANYQMFLSELCDVLGVDRPEPAGAERALNDYVFERAVRRRPSDDIASSLRIDLYKKGCFILEAKQSRLPGGRNALPGQKSLFGDEPDSLGKRSVARGWDVMMQNARRQAEGYVFLLDADHPAPPFIITCDVGHAFEIFADFTGTGRAYGQFPDRKGFRIYLEDLRDPDIRARLLAIWTDPLSLDPARESARVTRGIAKRLAAVSKALEAKHPPEDVAHFLMRCIFTMFAEDVKLLPENSFTELLADCLESPGAFTPLLEELWAKMDEPSRDKRFFSAFKQHLRYFNGNLFKNARAFPLGREEIGELLSAAKAKWTEVDPAIFGTLLEQALEPGDRRKLGAHYTPRSYVQRLVEVTVMEPLRADWDRVLTKAEDAKESGDEKEAVKLVQAFHHQLCATRVLDPACGTGNFLYVSLELMKKLEGEVLEVLARLGVSESLGLERETVDPHQFLGLELNPRAAAIAELVVWIGYLQQWYKVRDGHPAEPILRAFKNINFGRREGYDAVLTWDGYPVPTVAEQDGKRVETYPNARRPDWPEAEFIVGNPPFMGGKDLRSRMGSRYVETLWAVHKHMNESADFVMYWWDRAAELLTRKKTPLRRFGLVTTNSISQVFQRRVMEKHLDAKKPVSIIYAVADHPWTKATRDSAAVRIAMTVGEAGRSDGLLREVVSETGLDTDEPSIVFANRLGRINSDLTVGVDLSKANALLANKGLGSRGVQLMGSGFIITPTEAAHLGLGKRPGLDNHIRLYRNGRDLTARSRDVMVIDLFGLSQEQVRRDFPEIYQHLTTRVRYDLDEHGQPRTDNNGRKLGREWNNRESYKENWWVFGEPRKDLRPALEGFSRYITAYPYNPSDGPGYTEGWVAFNAAWNAALAWTATDATRIRIMDTDFGGELPGVVPGTASGIELIAPLNFDYTRKEEAVVRVFTETDSVEVVVRETARNSGVFRGEFRILGSGESTGQSIAVGGSESVTAAYGWGFLGAAAVLPVDSTTLTITTPSIPAAALNEAYGPFVLQAANAAGPLQWTLVDGSLPPGMLLAPAGEISGTPSEAGAFTFTLQAEDGTGTAEHVYSLSVDTLDSHPRIRTGHLPAVSSGEPYAAQLHAADGNGPAKWSLVSGLLPAGLTLGENGLISGRTTDPGWHAFTVRAEDSDRDADQRELALVVLETGTALILDSEDPEGITVTGSWTVSSFASGYAGDSYLHDQNSGKGSKAVRFTSDLGGAMAADVYLRWTAGSNRATNTPVDIVHASGTTTLILDQQENGSVWNYLGRWDFSGAAEVVIRNDGTNGYVIADAVRFVPTEPSRYRLFQERFFPGGAADPQAARSSDPDSDGRTNLREYADHTHPLSPANEWVTDRITRKDGTFLYTFAFDDNLGDTRTVVEYSTDLDIWSPLFDSEQDRTKSASKLAAEVPSPEAARAFFRRQVVLPAP
jgi:hypothetical protein